MQKTPFIAKVRLKWCIKFVHCHFALRCSLSCVTFFHGAPLLLSRIIMHIGTQYEPPTNVKGTPSCRGVDRL